MKISLNWLKEYIPNIKKNNIFVNELTALGLEVSSAKRIKKDTIMLCTSCTYIDMIGSKYSNIFMHYFRKYLQSFFSILTQ